MYQIRVLCIHLLDRNLEKSALFLSVLCERDRCVWMDSAGHSAWHQCLCLSVILIVCLQTGSVVLTEYRTLTLEVVSNIDFMYSHSLLNVTV